MAVDYAEMMQKGTPDDSAAARAPVVSFERVKPKRLTKKSKSALLKKRNAEKNTMAKKRRTAKQKAATKKMIAANRRRARGGKRGSGGRKTIRARRKGAAAAAYVVAREPSTAIVKYEHPTRVAVTKKKSSRKKSGKSGSRSKQRTAKQKAATRKMIAANRRRSSGKSSKSPKRKSPKRSAGKSRSSGRRGSSRGRRRARAVITVSASERRGRRRSRRRSGAMENPLTGVELFVGTLTGLMGFGTADVVDRLLATHALTPTTSGSTTTYMDTPPTAAPAQGTAATYGSLFNATAVCAPMNLERWGVGLLIAGVPMVIGHFISAPVGRSALQFFGFGALMRIAGKGLIDMVASLTSTNATGMQLYSGEQRAAAVLANNGGTANLPSNGTGLGRQMMAAAPNRSLGAPTLQLHKTGCGCGRCGPAGAGYPSMPAAVMTSSGTATAVPQIQTPPATTNTPAAPTTTTTTAIQGIPRGVGFRPSPGMYRWGEKAA